MATPGRRKPVSRPRGALTRSERQLLRHLEAGLSEGELQRVLACSVLTLVKGGALERLVKRLGEGTGGTLRALLEARAAGVRSASVRPGAGKVAEEWRRLWGEWDECVSESGLEWGRYVQQEYPGGPPYLDEVSLAEDLEGIAVRVRPLIARVVDEELAPGFSFAETLKRTDLAVAQGLPEWRGALVDGLYLGAESTTAFLEWEWRTLQRGRDRKRRFQHHVATVAGALLDLHLDDRAIDTFFAELP